MSEPKTWPEAARDLKVFAKTLNLKVHPYQERIFERVIEAKATGGQAILRPPMLYLRRRPDRANHPVKMVIKKRRYRAAGSKIKVLIIDEPQP